MLNALRWAAVLASRGEMAEFNRILAPFMVNPNAEVLRSAADALASVRQYREAERMMLRLIERVPYPSVSDWGALGDIRLSRGDRKGASQAYRFGVNEMLRPGSQSTL